MTNASQFRRSLASVLGIASAIGVFLATNVTPTRDSAPAEPNFAKGGNFREPSAKDGDAELARLCENPKRVVCRRVRVSDESLRRSIRYAAVPTQSKGQLSDAYLQELGREMRVEAKDHLYWQTLKNETQRRFFALVQAVEKEVFVRLEKRGITSEQVHARFHAHRQVLAEHVRSMKHFENAEQAGRAADTVAQLPLYMASDLVAGNSSVIDRFFSVCGVDGLNDQAAGDQVGLFLCPGRLIRLAHEPLHSLDSVIGHEFGHAIDLGAEDRLAPKPVEGPAFVTFRKAYEPYLTCLNTSKSVQLRSLAETANYVEATGIPGLEKILAMASSNPPGGMTGKSTLDLQRLIEDSRFRVLRLRNEDAQLRKIEPKLASPAYTHGNEMIADRYMIPLLTPELRDLAPEDKVARIVDQLNLFCPVESAATTLYGPSLDDGKHPPVDIRLQQILANRELREALGCSELAADAACVL